MKNRNIVTDVIAQALADPAVQRTLADALGNHLRTQLAGEQIYMPKQTIDQRQQRNQQIRRELAAGTPISEIQSRHRVSRRTIFRLRNGDATSA